MSNCSSGCPTPGEHATWGECLRAKNTHVGWANHVKNLDYSGEKKHQKRIQYVRKLRAQGIKPDSTSLSDARRAEEISNRTGTPYQSTR